MRSIGWLAWVILLCTACSTVHAAPSSQSAAGSGAQVFPIGERSPAPHLQGTTLNGDTLNLADVLGRGLVAINVWASWCGPCRREMPLLAGAAADDIHVIGIVERDSGGSARTFAASRGVTYPSLFDSDGKLLAQLPMLPQIGVPSTLFLDRDGLVAARVVGPLGPDTLPWIVRQLGGS